VEGINQAKDLTLTWEGTGTFVVLTDQPSGSVAARRTLSLPASGAERKTETFPLHDQNGEYLLGKLWAEQATTPSGLILHGGFYTMRRIGTYIAPGEVWKTQPITF